MTHCVFCHDNLNRHHSNLQHPGGVNRWLCGTCVNYAVTLRHIQEYGDMEREIARQTADVETKSGRDCHRDCGGDAMTAPITTLKFWGQKQNIYNGKFRFSFPELRLTVTIEAETQKTRCYWSIMESGSMQAGHCASGVKAARNAAQAWLENRAALTIQTAAKGRVK